MRIVLISTSCRACQFFCWMAPFHVMLQRVLMNCVIVVLPETSPPPGTLSPLQGSLLLVGAIQLHLVVCGLLMMHPAQLRQYGTIWKWKRKETNRVNRYRML